MDTKTGPSDLRYLIMCLQIPPPSYCAIQKHCNFAAEKVETVAAASFTRARQQVQRTNVACGFDATEPILAGIDSQYNNRLQSAGLNTPMQPATQVSTSIIEMQTKDKKVIGMHVSNKLCSKGDHTNCGIENGCTKNLEDTDIACVHGSTNGTNGRPISFKVLPMVPLVIPLVPMVPLVKTDGSQYCRQSTVWAKLPTLESHMIKYGVLNFKFINFTNKHCFYQDDIFK